MSISPFGSVCLVLITLYVITAFSSAIQFIRLMLKDLEASLSHLSIYPKTIQHQIHLIIFSISFFRITFFIVAMNSWNVKLGEIKSNKLLFYSADEYATALYFSLTSLQSLFWAELYYISIQQLTIYTNFVKPITYLVNALTLIAIAFCLIYSGNISS